MLRNDAPARGDRTPFLLYAGLVLALLALLQIPVAVPAAAR